ncbi:MAG: hypothetical protein ACPHO8_04865 [Mariniblastus sp.]
MGKKRTFLGSEHCVVEVGGLILTATSQVIEDPTDEHLPAVDIRE